MEGELSRSAAGQLSGYKERRARDVIRQLIDEGLLEAPANVAVSGPDFPRGIWNIYFPSWHSQRHSRARLVSASAIGTSRAFVSGSPSYLQRAQPFIQPADLLMGRCTPVFIHNNRYIIAVRCSDSIHPAKPGTDICICLNKRPNGKISRHEQTVSRVRG